MNDCNSRRSRPVIQALLALTLLPSVALAEGPWSGGVGAGIVATSGNTESRSQNVEYTLRYSAEESLWAWSSRGKLVQVSSQIEFVDQGTGESRKETQVTAENYRLDLRGERRLDAQNYLFGQADFVKDLFASVRTSTSQTLGYGRRLLASEERTLDVELGVGARQQEDQMSRESVDELIGQFALRFDTALGERARFGQQVQVQYGEENTVTDAKTKLKLSIVGALWAQLGFDLRHNSVASAGEESTDTTTSLSLLWEFGS